MCGKKNEQVVMMKIKVDFLENPKGALLVSHSKRPCICMRMNVMGTQ